MKPRVLCSALHKPDPQTAAGEIGERLDPGGIALGHGDDDGRFRQQDGLGKLLGHGRHETDVAGIIDIGELRIRRIAHRLHRGAENAAAVVDGGEIDSLAIGEFLQDRFDRESVDSAAVEHKRWFLRPGIAPGGSESRVR
jgi:hypothetical protein